MRQFILFLLSTSRFNTFYTIDPDKKFLQATPMAKMLEMFHEESLHVQSPLCFVTKFSHTPDLGRLLQISFEHLNIFYQFFWNKI